MRMHSAVLVSTLFSLTLAPGVVFGAGPNLGKPISPADLAPWDIDIEPSGAGLPAGSGTSDQGAAIFADNCSACHGDGGRGATTTTSGAPAPRRWSATSSETASTTRRSPSPITGPTRRRCSITSRRAMPWTSPRSLTDDEVYALTAYILAENKLIDAKQVINAQTLPTVQMPNRNGFIPRFPERTPHQ